MGKKKLGDFEVGYSAPDTILAFIPLRNFCKLFVIQTLEDCVATLATFDVKTTILQYFAKQL